MGKSNKIVLVKSDGTRNIIDSMSGMEVIFLGNNNEIIIYEGTKFFNCTINIISDMKIEIKNSKFDIVKLRIFGNHSNIKIGENFSCWGVEVRCHEENTSVTIGNDCMFSEEILIYPTDVHSILDQFTGEILNLSKPISIGNHVWCGRRSTFLKGSMVLNDSVVASHSLVTTAFEEKNIIVGGNPAKTIKRRINWARETPFKLQQKRALNNAAD